MGDRICISRLRRCWWHNPRITGNRSNCYLIKSNWQGSVKIYRTDIHSFISREHFEIDGLKKGVSFLELLFLILKSDLDKIFTPFTGAIFMLIL